MKTFTSKFGVVLMVYWVVATLASVALLSAAFQIGGGPINHTASAIMVGASGAILVSMLVLYTLAKLISPLQIEPAIVDARAKSVPTAEFPRAVLREARFAIGTEYAANQAA